MDSEVCSIDRTRCNLDLYLYITISEHFACDRAWREFSDLIFPIQDTLGYKKIIPVFLGQ